MVMHYIKTSSVYPLLTSICLHSVVFILIGVITLKETILPKGSVSVELSTVERKNQKLRRIIPKIPTRAVDSTKISKDVYYSTDMLISQLTVSPHTTIQASTILQYEPMEIASPILHSEGVGNFSMSAPRSEALPPMTYIRQAKIAEPKSQLLELFKSDAVIDTPDYKPQDPKILRDFLRIVSKKIERSKSYPKSAMKMELEGKVVVRFTILQNGLLNDNIQILDSSGAEVLDKAAITAVKDAAPFPVFPPELKRKSLSIELPMYFQLREL